jgi:probable HAF family extracellular repeat protein
LGVLSGGTDSYALGLNNANQIVGASLTLTGNHALIWQNGVANDLNNLIDASGWELKEACGINDPVIVAPPPAAAGD